MNSFELSVQRANTKAFIAADAVQVTLIPRNKEQLPSGGFRFQNGLPRTTQTMRIIPITDVVQPVQDENGVDIAPSFVLMGAHDAEMERFDVFVRDGVKYQILTPIRPDHTDQPYFKKADIGRV